MSTIALCIPAYNAAWSLPALFASVEKQAFPFDEILLYNDCSTDDTAILAERFGARVITGTKNRGCSYGKNQLAALAASDWLFFLDSDDELLPDFSEFVRKAIQEKGDKTDLVLLSYKYVDAKTGERMHIPDYNADLLENDPVRFMIRTKVVNVFLVKRSKFLSIHGFDLDPAVLYVEDRAYALKTALHGFRYAYIKNLCFQINRYPDSMSSLQPSNWLRAAVHLWRKTAEIAGERYKADICQQLFENAVWAAKYSDWNTVRNSLALAKEIDRTTKPVVSRPTQLLFSLSPFVAYFVREWLLRLKQILRGRHRISILS